MTIMLVICAVLMSKLCSLLDPLERLGLKRLNLWVMASVLAHILLTLYIKYAQVVVVKGGEMRKCSREIIK